MDLLEAMRKRKSIRGYKPETIPREVLNEILGVATLSASAVNTQPWEFTVVAGEVLDNIRQGNVEKLTSVAPNPDYPETRKEYQGIFRSRQVNLAVQIFKLMGIAREDATKRADWLQRGFRFFDAPAAIIISMDKSLDGTSLFDIGAIAQTICLVSLEYGLGTCIERQGIQFPDVIRKFTGIPDSKQIIIGISIGYPDWDFPANKLKSEREPVESLVAWHGFSGLK